LLPQSIRGEAASLAMASGFWNSALATSFQLSWRVVPAPGSACRSSFCRWLGGGKWPRKFTTRGCWWL